jgi:soluble cytochrome b562
MASNVMTAAKRAANLLAIRDVLRVVEREVQSATEKHGPMRGAHEGYAVILEEIDEAWEEIKHDNLPRARKEMVQVAAMAVRFLLDVA